MDPRLGCRTWCAQNVVYSISFFGTRVKSKLGQYVNKFERTCLYTLFYIGESIYPLHVRFFVEGFVSLKADLKVVVL